MSPIRKVFAVTIVVMLTIQLVLFIEAAIVYYITTT